MSSLAIAGFVFGGSFAAALLGMLLRAKLPAHHLDEQSRDVIKLVMGLVATMAALILGLLIGSANSSYNEQNSELQSLSVNVVMLDRMLVSYGPEAQGVRAQLHEALQVAHDRIWSPDGVRPANLEAADNFVRQLQGLSPRTETARTLQNRAMQFTEGILRTRLLMSAQASAAISWPFLTVLIFWISALFLGFGLFARFNATILAVLLIGALSVAAAIFLILELNEPYRGLMQISDAPLRTVLRQMDR